MGGKEKKEEHAVLTPESVQFLYAIFSDPDLSSLGKREGRKGEEKEEERRSILTVKQITHSYGWNLARGGKREEKREKKKKRRKTGYSLTSHFIIKAGGDYVAAANEVSKTD